MGCGASTPGVDSAKLVAQKKLAAKLDTLQKKKEEADSHILKLLILGAGESGKSTLFKQLNSLYGSGFNEEERKMYKPIIAANAISAIIMIGAMLAAALTEGLVGQIAGTLAVALAAVNVFGGFLVTQRMLEMFKKKEPKVKAQQAGQGENK